MLYHARERRLTLPDMQMDYITFGTGTRPLVMIHGLSTRSVRGTAVMMACLYRMFARDYRVYLFDRRSDIRDGVTVRELAADTARAMDALRIEHADIFGVSQGGMIAQYLALDRPDLVRRMVLVATLARTNERVRTVLERWVELARRGEMRQLVEDMAEKMYSAEYAKRYRLLMPLLTAVQKPRDVQRFAALAGACLTCDTYGELEKIRCPVLVLGGERDCVVGAEASREIAEKLGCPIYMYRELGHALYEEARDFNRRVYDFLQG